MVLHKKARTTAGIVEQAESKSIGGLRAHIVIQFTKPPPQKPKRNVDEQRRIHNAKQRFFYLSLHWTSQPAMMIVYITRFVEWAFLLLVSFFIISQDEMDSQDPDDDD